MRAEGRHSCAANARPVNAIAAVIFDMDGVLIDSEQIWDREREELVKARGGHWHPNAQREMMGMSSTEWARYMHDRLGVPLEPERINQEVIERISAVFRREVPVIPGALSAVERLAARWPLGLASSSNRPIIDLVLRLTGLRHFFAATVSSEEVTRGKPAPDVYVKATGLLGVRAQQCAGIEDSHNGILAVHAAGMRTIAIPNEIYPPGAQALAVADVVLTSIALLTPEDVEH